MATIAELGNALADGLGVERRTVGYFARRLREAGMMPSGRGGAEGFARKD